MDIQNHLMSTAFDTQQLTLSTINDDTPFAFIIENEQSLLDHDYQLNDTQEHQGHTFKDYSNNDSVIRTVDDWLILFKKDKTKLFNWSLSAQEFIQAQNNPEHIATVRYYFNFPKGRYSDKAVKEIFQQKGISTETLFTHQSPFSEAIQDLMFSLNELSEELLKALETPLDNAFSIEQIVEMGYLQSGRDPNMYFVEPDNYYYQKHTIPKIIRFNDNDTPVRKQYELDTPQGHVVDADLLNQCFIHPVATLKNEKLYSIQMNYRDDSFSPVANTIYSVFNKNGRPNVLQPYMGYPNGYDLNTHCFKWFQGEQGQNIADITEQALSFLDSQQHDDRSAFSKAYFNYQFNIGDTEAFQDTLDMIHDIHNISEFEAFLIEPHIEGDFFYKEVYQALKDQIQSYS